eukprot:m.176797 g.176797  ORF g.176797 m.176797 type:complete len:59 (+) comp39148_c0_seq7:1821-1997(+)
MSTRLVVFQPKYVWSDSEFSFSEFQTETTYWNGFESVTFSCFLLYTLWCICQLLASVY